VKRRFRLTRSSDIKRVRRCGKSYAHPLVVLLAHPHPDGETGLRLGVTASRSVGGAVQRNKAKRRLRASLQELLPEIQPGWDLLFLARAPIVSVDYSQLKEAVRQLLHRAGVLAVKGGNNECE